MNEIERKRHNRRLANHRDMDAKRRAERDILRTIPEAEGWVKKLDSCKPSRPCNLSMCNHCAGDGDENSHIKSDSKNYTIRNTGRGAKSNYRNRGGVWLFEPFHDRNQNNVHPFTLNLRLCAKDFDPKVVTASVRRELRHFLDQYMPDAVVRGMFDVAVKEGPVTRLRYPKNAVDADIGDGDFWLKFHLHGFIWHPRFKQQEIAKYMRQYFAGLNRVAFSNPHKLGESRSGHETGGPEGWGEYAAMEKTELSLNSDDPENDNVAAFKGLTKLRLSWSRQSRRITYGTHKGLASRRGVDHRVPSSTSKQNNTIFKVNDVSESKGSISSCEPILNQSLVSFHWGNGGSQKHIATGHGITDIPDPALSYLAAPISALRPP